MAEHLNQNLACVQSLERFYNPVAGPGTIGLEICLSWSGGVRAKRNDGRGGRTADKAESILEMDYQHWQQTLPLQVSEGDQSTAAYADRIGS
jgi:hypothetical protein